VEKKFPQIKKMQPKIKIKKFTDEHELQPAAHEEHFILRLPPALKKELSPLTPEGFSNIQIQTKENSRHGKLTYKNVQYNTVLCDLPCIVESSKTIDNKQFYKTADISQIMLVKPLTESTNAEKQRDYQFEHGLTNPLIDVRTNRFRKRMSKKVIEIVEMQVEKLLQKDLDSEDVRWEVHENTNDLDSMSESSSDVSEEDVDMNDGQEEAIPEDEFDLAAAIDEALDNEQSESEGEDEEKDEEVEEEEEIEQEEEEEDELMQMQKSLKHEIATLTVKLREKLVDVDKQVNVIMKDRFKQICDKLEMEINHKQEQLQKVEEEINDGPD
jgi:transcription initiation factor TFIID subunit 7